MHLMLLCHPESHILNVPTYSLLILSDIVCHMRRYLYYAHQFMLIYDAHGTHLSQ